MYIAITTDTIPIIVLLNLAAISSVNLVPRPLPAFNIDLFFLYNIEKLAVAWGQG